MTQASSPQPTTQLTKKQRFMGAIEHKPIDRPPVWLMRQAGRYLPEYQAVKAQYTFHEMCRMPDIAADVSIQPFDIFGVDAIIVFNDILIPLQNMGFTVEYKEGGPVVEPPARCHDDLSRIQPAIFDETPPVFDSLTEIRRRVGDDVPVLGFAGSPFTMAAYMSEGVTSKNLRHIKTLVYGQPDLLQQLLERVTETVIDYLRIQIKAGVNAVQIFDTWAGALSKEAYRKFALPYQQQVIKTIQDEGTPVILYVKNSPHVFDELGESGAAVVSVDWLTPLREAHQRLGASVALQGNMDPTALYAHPEAVVQETQRILNGLDRATGYVANLGHGILPETPVESVRAFVETVKGYEYASHSA